MIGALLDQRDLGFEIAERVVVDLRVVQEHGTRRAHAARHHREARARRTDRRDRRAQSWFPKPVLHRSDVTRVEVHAKALRLNAVHHSTTHDERLLRHRAEHHRVRKADVGRERARRRRGQEEACRRRPTAARARRLATRKYRRPRRARATRRRRECRRSSDRLRPSEEATNDFARADRNHRSRRTRPTCPSGSRISFLRGADSRRGPPSPCADTPRPRGSARSARAHGMSGHARLRCTIGRRVPAGLRQVRARARARARRHGARRPRDAARRRRLREEARREADPRRARERRRLREALRR